MTDYKAPLTSRKLLMELKLPLKFCSVYLRYSATVMRVSERYKDSYTVGLCVFFYAHIIIITPLYLEFLNRVELKFKLFLIYLPHLTTVCLLSNPLSFDLCYSNVAD